MFQNRVNPFGDIIQTTARGKWLGNRGQLHGAGKTILRQFKHQAWIICQLQFKNRHRKIMAPNLWTELFFLDEATALAAGHRPCFECRRADANRFKAAWIKGNPGYGFDMKIPIGKLDEVMHAERIGVDGKKISFQAKLEELPDRTFIEIADEPYLVKKQLVYHWTPFGYHKGKRIKLEETVKVLTPRSVVNAMKEYRPSELPALPKGPLRGKLPAKLSSQIKTNFQPTP